jgi:hypothetical protein
VPAAAVIPAPIAYIKVAAVKKLVVGFLTCCACPATATYVSDGVYESSFDSGGRSFTGSVDWVDRLL